MPKKATDSLEMQLARIRAEEDAAKNGWLPARAYQLSKLRPIRMRITTDLTRYHSGLVSGAEGTTQFEPATYGIWCYFSSAGRWDILAGKDSSFEIIDEEYLRLQVEDRDDEVAAVRSAPTATLFLGPRGGFRCLRIERGAGKCPLEIHDREKAEEYKQLLQDAGIAIQEQRA